MAARSGVSPSYVSRTRPRQRDLCDAEPGLRCDHVPVRPGGLHDALRARVATDADATLTELRAWVAAEHGVSVSRQVMWKTLRQLCSKSRGGAAEAGCGGRLSRMACKSVRHRPNRLVFIND